MSNQRPGGCYIAGCILCCYCSKVRITLDLEFTPGDTLFVEVNL